MIISMKNIKDYMQIMLYEETFQHPIIYYRKIWRWENKKQVFAYYMKKIISFFY